MIDTREEAALLVLLTGKAKFPDVVREVCEAGSALTVLAEPGALFHGRDPELESAQRKISRWRAQGLNFVTLLDPDYPAQLREIQEAPPFLFWQGELKQGDRAVSVVGTRKPSPEGAAFARKVAAGLVEAGLTVASGLAAGIDAIAHTETLTLGGRTVAVLGNGISRAYPRENAELQERIARRGLLLSQFFPDAQPAKWTFPARNAVMSGYGRASIVVEASEHSGTRTQARLAHAHGRATIVSTAVANTTSWGARLSGMSGVYLAHSPEEAVTLAVELSTPLTDLLRTSH